MEYKWSNLVRHLLYTFISSWKIISHYKYHVYGFNVLCTFECIRNPLGAPKTILTEVFHCLVVIVHREQHFSYILGNWVIQLMVQSILLS
jgi:hypothetical protein